MKIIKARIKAKRDNSPEIMDFIEFESDSKTEKDLKEDAEFFWLYRYVNRDTKVYSGSDLIRLRKIAKVKIGVELI